MNKSLFLILIVFTMFFISCEEKTTTYTSCNPHCNEWETCNDNSGICELNNLRCIDNEDCKNNLENPVCSLIEHKCIEDNTPECTVNSDCTDNAKPICDNGICVEDNTPECTVNSDCIDNAKPVCDNGTCIEDNCIGLSYNEIKMSSQDSNHYVDLVIEGNYYLSVEFYPESSIGNYNLASLNINDNYETCKQCVLIYKFSEDANANVEKIFFQSQGNINIIKGDVLSGESAGEITNIKLIEVTMNETTFHTTPVNDGSQECIEIETGTQWKWDTMPTCELNATRCTSDKSKIEKCTDSENNIWTTIDECDANKECKLNEGSLVCELKTGACDPQTQRCNENNIEICNEDGFTWEITPCVAPSICVNNNDSFICETEVDDCSGDETACEGNTNGKTICLNGSCVIPVEVDDCSGDETACEGNTNGKTICLNGSCVIPAEVDDCSGDETACEGNTNGKTICLNGSCVIPAEVDDCSGDGNECDSNRMKFICNESTLKCVTPPLNGNFESWLDGFTPNYWTKRPGMNIEKSDSNFHLGVASAKLTRLSGYGNGAVKIYTDRAYPVHENSSYSITSYILDNDNGVSGYMGYILCEAIDTCGSEVLENTGSIDSENFLPHLINIGVIPSGINYIKILFTIKLENSASTGSLYIDDVMLMVHE